MSSIYSWSTTAGDNATADTAINWQEGMFPSAVNDSARQMMGRVAEFLADQRLTVTGTNSLTATASSGFTAYQNGLRITIRAANTNTGAVTINVNTLGSKAILKRGGTNYTALVGGELRAGVFYSLTYDASALTGTGAWIVNETAGEFPSGTRMLFQQTNAPTGWTKDTTHNNKALRIVSGSVSSGGTVAFTTAFASKAVAGTVGATTLNTNQIPAHSHGSGSLSADSAGSHAHTGSANAGGNHNHQVSGQRVSIGRSVSGSEFVAQGANPLDPWTTGNSGDHTHTLSINSAGAHTHNVSGSTSNQGGGQSHTHSFTGTAINLDVQYVDVIIATKD